MGRYDADHRRRTVVGTRVWDLDELAAQRRDNGLDSALALIGATAPSPHPPSTRPQTGTTNTPRRGARRHGRW